MSLRSLRSLLTRRLMPRGSGISGAQAKARRAQAPAPAGMPERALHSPRDFSVGDSVAAAALAGLVGILYFIKVPIAGDGKVTKEESREEAKKQLAGQEPKKQGAPTKEHNDGDDFSLEEYLAEMTKIAAEEKQARYERSCKKAVIVKEVRNSEAINDEAAMKDEEAMKARFEEWIKEYGKRYKNKEEKARRYELFKACANMVDKATAQGGAVFVTNHTADWTEEECKCLYDDDVDWDDYLDHIQSLIDKKNAKAKIEG